VSKVSKKSEIITFYLAQISHEHQKGSCLKHSIHWIHIIM